jgi:hypothetical protein
MATFRLGEETLNTARLVALAATPSPDVVATPAARSRAEGFRAHVDRILDGQDRVVHAELVPDIKNEPDYEAALAAAVGEARKEAILTTDIHHVLIYPGLSVQSPLQQLRVVRPLGVDRTLTEIWHFRLKGAPEPIYRRALAYYNLVNSPSTLINADDLENFWKCQQGLASDGGDWVSFHRHFGRDIERPGITETADGMGTSEAPMRNQMKAWVDFMTRAS